MQATPPRDTLSAFLFLSPFFSLPVSPRSRFNDGYSLKAVVQTCIKAEPWPLVVVFTGEQAGSGGHLPGTIQGMRDGREGGERHVLLQPGQWRSHLRGPGTPQGHRPGHVGSQRVLHFSHPFFSHLINSHPGFAHPSPTSLKQSQLWKTITKQAKLLLSWLLKLGT